MKKLLFVFVLALACAASSIAGPGGCTSAPWLNPFAFEAITVSTSAIGFTATVYAPAGQPVADMAIATLETADLRYRSDGVNPTAGVGQVLAAQGTLSACGAASIRQLRFIRVSADSTLSVAYYRESN